MRASEFTFCVLTHGREKTWNHRAWRRLRPDDGRCRGQSQRKGEGLFLDQKDRKRTGQVTADIRKKPEFMVPKKAGSKQTQKIIQETGEVPCVPPLGTAGRFPGRRNQQAAR